VVVRTPTTDLMLALEPHVLPKGSDYLRSEDELVVSSVKAKKDAEADQRLTARGNAEFRDDNRTGLGDKIVYDGTRVTLESSIGRMAALHSNKRAVNQQQSMRAKKFIYNSVTGVVELNESSGGTLIPGK
jgi:lipopolysaccharide export system protein LptA